MPFSNGKKRGVFSPLYGRIAPRSVRLDAHNSRSIRRSYFPKSGTTGRNRFPTPASPSTLPPPPVPDFLHEKTSDILPDVFFALLIKYQLSCSTTDSITLPKLSMKIKLISQRLLPEVPFRLLLRRILQLRLL